MTASDRPWLEFYDPAVPDNIEYADFNDLHSLDLHSFFQRAVRLFSHKTAMVFLGNHISYRDLGVMVDRYAAALAACGIQRGFRVGIQLPNCPQFAAAYFAALKLGAIPVPIDMRHSFERIKEILIVTKPCLVITLSKILSPAYEATRSLDYRCPVAFTSIKKYMGWPAWMYFSLFLESNNQLSANLIDEVIDWDHLEANQRFAGKIMPPAISHDVTALIQYTGGITGVPRPVIHTHSSLIASFLQSRGWLVNFKEGREVVAAILPWTHVYGQVTTLLTGLLTGSKLIVEPDPTMPDFWARFVKLIHRHQVSVFPGVPFFFEKILKLPINHRQHLKSTKLCISGGAALSPDLKSQFELASQSLLVNGYGLSECPIATINPVFVGNGNNWRRTLRDERENSVGLPISSTEIKILNPDDKGIGEIAIRGPQVMSGYWGDNSGIESVLVDGWLHTGDIGSMDCYGFIYVIDRFNDVFCFKNTGTKIFPSHVEEVISGHRNIKDVAVVGLDYGQGLIPVAFIVTQFDDGISLSDIWNSVVQYCFGKLEQYQIPQIFFVLNEIPKSPLGKPLRRLLREKITY